MGCRIFKGQLDRLLVRMRLVSHLLRYEAPTVFCLMNAHLFLGRQNGLGMSG